jgi:hypothetical protein
MRGTFGHREEAAGQDVGGNSNFPAMGGARSAPYYATETLNIPDRLASGPGADLDIAFLGTVALQQAGLPLDPIFATRATLLDHCRETYFGPPTERKRRFHRTLVDLIDMGSRVQCGRYSPTRTK